MGFRRASEFAPKSGNKAQTTSSAGKKSEKQSTHRTQASKPGSVDCPDCLGKTGNLTCARCDGTGLVCSRCKGIGFVYQAGTDGRTLSRECACGKAALRRTIALWPFLERYSSLHGELLSKSLENFETRAGHPDVKAALDASKSFARLPRGWLVISGTPGVGKTHLAAAIANALIKRRQLVLFLNVPELLGFLRAGFSNSSRGSHDPDFDQRLATIKDFPVLILDDWGAHSDTPWADEQLYLVLNHRTERLLPTVITSNQHLEEIEPPRVQSRLRNSRIAAIIEIFAPDFRLQD